MHCALLEEDAMHLGTEADVSAHVLDISGKKTQLRGLLDTGAVSRIRLSAANKGAHRVIGRTPIIALNLGERNLWLSFPLVENLDESEQFILGRHLKTRYEMTENVKENEVLDCPNHRDKICILRRLKKIKCSSGLVKSLKT